jgi:hypothetical protein
MYRKLEIFKDFLGKLYKTAIFSQKYKTIAPNKKKKTSYCTWQGTFPNYSI